MNSVVQYCAFCLLCGFVYWVQAECEDDSVRLTGGPNELEGRVELCVDGNWGQVCGMMWTGDDADVVCRQLGYNDGSLAVLSMSDVYDDDVAPARVRDVQCDGGEGRLVDCPHQSIGGSDTCAAYMRAAGVVCGDSVCMSDSTSVRLSDKQAVEVCIGAFRTGVCSNSWDNTDASVVCRQLNLGNNGVANSTASINYWRAGAYDKVNCVNTDQQLSDCSRQQIGGAIPRNRCSTGQFATVECNDTVTMAATTLAATTTPPAETTAPLDNDSTTTDFEDPDSTTTTTTTDVEENPTTDDTTPDPSEITTGSESQSDSHLLAIVLGAVGGAIALLLFVVVVLLVIIIQSRGKIRKLTSQILENRNDLAIANPHGLLDMQDNQAYYSKANEQSTEAMYEEISPNWVSTGELDMLNITANEAYQQNIIAQNNETVDEFYTEAISEAHHVASTGAITMTIEEISPSSNVNGQPDEAKVFTKPNEAYQIPGSAAMIESKENEAYGACNTEVFTMPNEAYQIPGSAAMIKSKENEAYGALIGSKEL